MPANDTPRSSAEDAVMTGEMPRSPAYQCAFDASFGIGRRSYPDKRKRNRAAPNHFLHRSLP